MNACERCGNEATDLRYRGTAKVCIDCVIVEVERAEADAQLHEAALAAREAMAMAETGEP